MTRMARGEFLACILNFDDKKFNKCPQSLSIPSSNGNGNDNSLALPLSEPKLTRRDKEKACADSVSLLQQSSLAEDNDISARLAGRIAPIFELSS